MNSNRNVNDSITGQVNHFKATGLTFSIGEEINPAYQDMVVVLKHLYTGGYVEEYKLVRTTIPLEILFTSGTKDQYHALVPQIVRNAEWAVQVNALDVYDKHNYRLIVGVYVLSWYWYHKLGGPKPEVKGLKDVNTRKIVQNEPLQCPCCYKKFSPSMRLVTQEAKMWAFILWLPTHCVEYHLWTPPSRLKSLVTKSVLNALEQSKKSRSKQLKGGQK